MERILKVPPEGVPLGTKKLTGTKLAPARHGCQQPKGVGILDGSDVAVPLKDIRTVLYVNVTPRLSHQLGSQLGIGDLGPR